MPVSILGAITYGVMLVSTLLAALAPAERAGAVGRFVLRAAATLAALLAFWFMGLQLFWIRSVCPYCTATHACSLAIGLTLVISRSRATADSLHQGTRQALQAVLKQSRMGPRAPTQEPPSAADADSVRRAAWKSPALLGLLAAIVAICGQFVSTGPQARLVVQQADELQPVGQPAETSVEEQPEASSDRSGLAASAADVSTIDDIPPQSRPVAAERSAATVTPQASKEPAARPPAVIQMAPRQWTILGGKRTLDVTQFPLLGRPDAEFLVGKIFDYCCPHCRELERQFELAQPRYGDRLAIVLIPVPLNSGCNRAVGQTYPRHAYACLYAKLALAIWKESPDRFPEFHRWLFDPIDPPEPAAAKREARRLLDDQDPDELSSQPWVEQQLEKCVDLYELCGSRGIPKLILGSAVAKGTIKSVDELCAVLEAHLGIKALPPQAADRSSVTDRSTADQSPVNRWPVNRSTADSPTASRATSRR
jgi:protein-disulfide isomerase